MARLVVFIVVVVPLTVRLPATTISLGKPIVIVPELSATSTSFAVPENVAVPPKAIAVELEPSETLIEELLNFELPILPASFEAAIDPANIVFDTELVSPVPTRVPVATGNVNTALLAAE